ncbi:MAG: hypothetical protein QOI13_3675 [Paraburkholderia sp.]|jgi:hypothetical protein|nr:hypothetical protein [Paraburkholderia sp.]
MASISRRNDKWQVRVRRKGFPVEVKTFNTRADAEQWARSVEIEMDRGSFVSRSTAEATTLKKVIERYIIEVCPSQRGCSDGDTTESDLPRQACEADDGCIDTDGRRSLP